MHKPIIIDTPGDPALAPFANLTERQLRRSDLFVAESPKVIMRALEAGYQPISLLCEEKHLCGDAAPILHRCPDLTVYTGTREILAKLTGYTLTRGVLCTFKRREMSSAENICRDACRVAVLVEVSDSTNIGTIFRSAAALGIDAVLLGSDCCDPFNRRAVRVSMGSVFLVPWTWTTVSPEALSALGFTTVSLALCDTALSIEAAALQKIERMAIILGSEGYGLPQKYIDDSEYVARIPMAHDVDSLNVGAAAAVAFWELRHR